MVPAQGDGVGRPAGPGVAVGEVVDQEGIDGGEVLGLPDAALGPFQGMGGTAGGVEFTGDEQVGVTVRREVGGVHGDHRVDVPPRLRKALHQVLLGPAGAVDLPCLDRVPTQGCHPPLTEQVLVVERVDARQVGRVAERVGHQPVREFLRVGAGRATGLVVGVGQAGADLTEPTIGVVDVLGRLGQRADRLPGQIRRVGRPAGGRQ